MKRTSLPNGQRSALSGQPSAISCQLSAGRGLRNPDSGVRGKQSAVSGQRPANRCQRPLQPSTFPFQRSSHSGLWTLDSGFPPRGGFTLIEVLAVIFILAILAAMLLPAINSARTAARNATVVADIKNLEKAIADFKLQYGVEPPSSFVLYEQGSNWISNTDALTRNSLAIIRQIWPDFDISANIDLNGNLNTNDTFILCGSECLTFFLMGPGVISAGATEDLVVTGFSANPKYPFSAGGNRVGPFIEADAARLIDIDGDGVRELLDPLPGQTMPYQYFSSYNGRGYQVGGLDNDITTVADNESLTVGGSPTMLVEYLKNDTQWNIMGYQFPDGPSWNLKSFQIISPGFDGEYGIGGTYSSEKGVAVKTDSMDIYRYSKRREVESDNITNFSGGPLGGLFTP